MSTPVWTGKTNDQKVLDFIHKRVNFTSCTMHPNHFISHCRWMHQTRLLMSEVISYHVNCLTGTEKLVMLQKIITMAESNDKKIVLGVLGKR